MKERLQYKDEADFVLGLCGEKSFLLMSTTSGLRIVDFPLRMR
jgi:hypothetical protein